MRLNRRIAAIAVVSSLVVARSAVALLSTPTLPGDDSGKTIGNELNYFKGSWRNSGSQAVAQSPVEIDSPFAVTRSPDYATYDHGEGATQWNDSLSGDSLVFCGLTSAPRNIGRLGSVVLQSNSPASDEQRVFEYATADLRIASPEPGVVVLIAAGTTLLLWRRRRRFAC